MNYSLACADVPRKCSETIHYTEIGNKTASAGFFSNLIGRDGSIELELERSFYEAKEAASKNYNSPGSCNSPCKLSLKPLIFINSIPNKFKSDYAEAKKCDRLLVSTSASPLVYSQSGFRSFDGLSNWISDFSRGRSEAGKDLYRRCDGDCSPRYYYLIDEDSGSSPNYSVKVSVQCGPARDKGDDLYRLQYGIAWLCNANEL